MTPAAPAVWTINGRFLSQPQTGVQRYAGEITKAIDTWLAADETLSRRMRWNIALPTDARDIPPFDAIAVRRSTRGRGYLWEQTILPTMVADGLVSFANLGPLALQKQILCLHDANVFLEPSSYSRGFLLAYRALFPMLARRVQAVTTVSGFSADMLDAFKITRGRTRNVISNGHEHALRWNASRSRFDAHGHFQRPYVFALGSRAKHKQLDLLLGLAPALEEAGIDIVISGGSSTIFAGSTLQQSANVFPLGFVTDDDLAALFRHALCFAFPSRTEGFGLPLLEAMVHGAPIVSADCASMPEVCGDAALYAPADAPAVWLEQIKRYAGDAALRAEMRARGQARYPRFAWKDSARKYLDLAASLSAQSALRQHPASAETLQASPS